MESNLRIAIVLDAPPVCETAILFSAQRISSTLPGIVQDDPQKTCVGLDKLVLRAQRQDTGLPLRLRLHLVGRGGPGDLRETDRGSSHERFQRRIK